MMPNEVLAMLNRLELAFRQQTPEKLAIYVDALLRNRVTPGQLGDAVNLAIERFDRFPSVAELLKLARPEAVNMPRRDEDEPHEDSLMVLEREIEVQNAWLRRFANRHDEYGQRMARLEIERVSRKVNDRLAARGRGPRFVAPGVEDFGSDGRAEKTVPLKDILSGWLARDEQ